MMSLHTPTHVAQPLTAIVTQKPSSQLEYGTTNITAREILPPAKQTPSELSDEICHAPPTSPPSVINPTSNLSHHKLRWLFISMVVLAVATCIGTAWRYSQGKVEPELGIS